MIWQEFFTYFQRLMLLREDRYLDRLHIWQYDNCSVLTGKKESNLFVYQLMGTCLTETSFFWLRVPDGYKNDPSLLFVFILIILEVSEIQFLFTFVLVMIPIHGTEFSWEDVPQSVHIVRKMKLQLVLTCWVCRHHQLYREKQWVTECM